MLSADSHLHAIEKDGLPVLNVILKPQVLHKGRHTIWVESLQVHDGVPVNHIS